MKYADINRRFTEIVADYIKHGYSINTATMSGSHGEVAHIDLTDGKSVIRIVLQKFYRKGDFYNDGYEIVVGEAEDSVRADQSPSFTVGTVWNNRLTICRCEEFYEIGNQRYDCTGWFGTREEARAAMNTVTERALRKNYSDSVQRGELTGRAVKIAERYICRVTGIKRLNLTKLSVRHAIREGDSRAYHTYGEYIITYNGKVYTLH